ncbi:MAG: zinc ribbon domain-containing protein [Oscillospiraceae bacterium]|nr:zinc ribbon domain-containing protein [Oscillospiraceae bacterium]
MTELLMSYSRIVYYGTAPQHTTSSGLDFSSILNAIFSGSDFLGKAGSAIKGFGEFLNVFSVIYSILSVIILCYFGYVAFRTILTIQGFIGGALVGALIGFGMGLSSSPDGAVPGAVIGALVVGFIGALLAHLLYKLGVFLFFAGGTFIVMLLLVGLGSGGDWKSAMTAGAIVGVIVGIIAVIVDKYFIIAGTAAIGAFTGGSMLMFANTVLGIFAIIILLVTGILVQVKLTGKPGNKNNDRPRTANSPAYGNAQYYGGAPEQSPNAICTCTNCGHINPPGKVFCEQCDYRLEKTAAPAYPAPDNVNNNPSLLDRLSDQGKDISKLRRCPNCGELVSVLGNTCEKCYAPLMPVAPDFGSAPAAPARTGCTCVNCGHTNPIGTIFCEKCDFRLEKSAASSVNEQLPNANNFGMPFNNAPNFGAAPVNNAHNFGTAPVNGTPNYSTAPVNSAPNYSTAPVNSAPNYSTAPVNSAPNYSTAPVNNAPNFGAAPIFTQQRCPGCNGMIEPGERFCSSCGRPIA